MFHAYVVDALQSSFALPLDATVRIYSRTRRHTLEYGFTHSITVCHIMDIVQYT